MINLEQASYLHAKIWFLDDLRDYRSLRKNVQRLLENQASTLRVSKHISEAYSLYGHLQDNKIKTAPPLVFKQIFLNFLGAYSTGRVPHPKLQAYFTLLWWEQFFYKDQITILRYMKIILAVFLLHLVRLGFFRFGAVISCSRYCLLAGYHGHDKKDFKLCQRYLMEYWRNVPPNIKFISF